MRQIDDTFLFAVKEGYTEIVKLLLEAGADVNAKTVGGYTALSIAESKRYTEITELLKKQVLSKERKKEIKKIT